MSCPKCQADVPEGSAFCNRCGASLAPVPSPAVPQAPSGSASAEPEQEVWRGRFSLKTHSPGWLLWGIWVALLVYGWFALTPQGRVLRWAFPGAAALPAVILLWKGMVQKARTRYRLTNYRLIRETGILSRRIDEIELMRVDDVSVQQNLAQRVFNVGTIRVIAPTDSMEPHLEIVGIDNPIELKETLRQQVRRRRERSLHIESL